MVKGTGGDSTGAAPVTKAGLACDKPSAVLNSFPVSDDYFLPLASAQYQWGLYWESECVLRSFGEPLPGAVPQQGNTADWAGAVAPAHALPVPGTQRLPDLCL